MVSSPINKASFLIVIYYISFITGNEAHVSTACYGIKMACTVHQLQCASPLVISVLNATYGFRSGCLSAVSYCFTDTALCCVESPGDCFVSFNQTELSDLQLLCFNTFSCAMAGFRTDLYCDNTRYSAYSKIEYTCISTESSTTLMPPEDSTPTPLSLSQSTLISTLSLSQTTLETYDAKRQLHIFGPTSDTDILVIIGSVIAVVVIIGLNLFIYKRMKMNSKINPSWQGVNTTTSQETVT